MADKRVQIGVEESADGTLPALSLAFLRVTSVEAEENLDSDIVLGFHAHNNFQLGQIIQLPDRW